MGEVDDSVWPVQLCTTWLMSQVKKKLFRIFFFWISTLITSWSNCFGDWFIPFNCPPLVFPFSLHDFAGSFNESELVVWSVSNYVETNLISLYILSNEI